MQKTDPVNPNFNHETLNTFISSNQNISQKVLDRSILNFGAELE